MKILHILISLALVNVLVAIIDKYHKLVIITNRHIELAKERMVFMFAVPDFAGSHQTLSSVCQNHLRTVIRSVTGIKAPEINEGDFADVNLSASGNARRNLTREAIQILIRLELRKENPSDKDYYMMCRLIGLFISAKYPGPYYIEFATYNDGICELVVINHLFTIRYKYIGGVIWEINEKDLLVKPFIDELNNFDQELQR
ncbi:uncharacterized protein LOC126835928 isoform X2 [Adelges cooleyi]|uniref:uncharacterized protein LOC126835928 isoform X2 n=1 Tax=Adelges cooleyi TaxID=133065 RepID=UPI00217F9C0F|nr:uncharacterized protein LOC126835928 isoform X2 [Adelges cooleyi]